MKYEMTFQMTKKMSGIRRVNSLLLVLAFVVGFCGFAGVFSTAQAATNKQKASNNYKNLQSNQSKFTSRFASGSIVSGSKANSRNSERRWYIFNEGAVGGSYSMLGSATYWAVDLGYNVYLRTIDSTKGGVSFIAGAGVNFPIYLKANGKSNILSDHRGFQQKDYDGILGWGSEIPVMIGIEKSGFYLTGLVGYGWLFMNDIYPVANAQGSGAFPRVETSYDGIIYGAGLGYKLSNVINIGFRYFHGDMTNRKNDTKPDVAAEANGITSTQIITHARGRDVYGIAYDKFQLFVAFIF